MARVLVVSNDLVQPRMAGPGIRNYELALQLAQAGHRVTLAAPALPEVDTSLLALAGHDPDELRRLAVENDVVVAQGWVLETFPFLRRGPAALVVDLYDPFPLETLVSMRGHPEAQRREVHDNQIEVLVEQLRDGDFFLCASERQRDYWLGALTAMGRVNTDTYDADPTLRSLIDLVPFGIPEQPPQRRGPAMRGVIPGIGEGDFVVLWGGGLYNWFDPLTLVHGVALAAADLPSLRVVLHAARHPNPSVGVMSVVEATRTLAGELGLTGRHVFFNETWIAYEDRADWLLEADVGVSTHPDHIESRLAFRTRMLDYLWARLPILCTEGDALADDVRERGLGITVPPGDPGAVAAALRGLADPGYRAAASERVAEHARTLTWARTSAPLLAFCAAPRHAPDRRGATVTAPSPVPAVAARSAGEPGPRGVRRVLRRASDELAAGGVAAVATGGARWLRRRLGAAGADRPAQQAPTATAAPAPPTDPAPAVPGPVHETLDRIHHELVCIRQAQRTEAVGRLLERFEPQSRALARHELGAFSQNGEDGVLLEILLRLGLREGCFAEIGASSAQANCLLLCDVLGWGGVFADASAEEYAGLERKYRHRPDVRTLHARVTRENVGELLREAGVPPDLAVLSIDVDGNDYWIWEGVEGFRPAVVVIEHNASLDPHRCLVQPYEPDRTWDGSAFFGASLGALRRLGRVKGYRLVGVELSGTNAFFVREDLAAPFEEYVTQRAANYLLTGMMHPEPAGPAKYIDLEAAATG